VGIQWPGAGDGGKSGMAAGDRLVGAPSPSVTVERRAEIEPLAAEWDDLADRVSAMPWIRPGWIGAWWRAFGRGELEVLVVRRAGRLAGVVPLARRHGELRSTTNGHSPGFCLLAEDDEARRELAAALMGSRCRRVSLRMLPSTGAGAHECDQAAATSGRVVITRSALRSPCVATEGDWAAYERRLSRTMLRELRRRRRRLERLGMLVLDVQDGSWRLEELLAEALQVEAAGWKGARGTAIASWADTRRFYGEVARWAVARGWLRLAFLRLDGRPIAFDLCLEENCVHYLVKTGYDPVYREFGPGKLLHQEMLARAFAGDVRTYQFLGADDPWKLEWTSSTREAIVMQAFRKSLTGLADRAAWTYGYPLARRLRAARGR
jgi:CelD/BcsL family acetyltransferase involved in cellulose biosynthesis